MGDRFHAGCLGMIGLGMMGFPMARHMARGDAQVCVFDVRPEAVSSARAEGLRAMASVKEVAQLSEILFTCLPGPEVIQQVYTGPDGLIENVRQGSIVCELSTTSPEASEQFQRALAGRGAEYVEATMIGPPSAAIGREIFFIVGGNAPAVARIEPLLKRMGRGYRFVGPVGSASRTKLLHNALGVIHAVAASEVLALCVKIGVDPEALIEVVREAAKSRGIGYSTFFDLHAADIVKARDGGAGRLYIGAKDAHLARMLADSVRYPAPLLREADAMFEEAMRAGWGEREFTAVSKVIEKRLGEPIFGIASRS